MSLAQSQIEISGGRPMSEVTGYAQVLRAIGQALETLKLQSFEIEPAGEEFTVRGTIAPGGDAIGDGQVNRSQLRSIWGELPNHSRMGDGPARIDSSVTTTAVELRYTIKDVERLDYEGQMRRTDPNRIVEAGSLSQILRCIGAYLNQKRARLLKIAREGEAVLLEYETSLGSQLKESFALSDLYDMWVRMYLQRAGRVSQ
jgi:hypothetical protein